MRPSVWPIAALGFALMLHPFAIDLYLPGLPAMASEFDKPLSYMEASVFVFLIGFAAGQLIMGPIADQIGRRRTMISGVSAFTVASLVIWANSDPAILLIMRLVQALGVSTTVGALPLVRDILGEERSRSAISWIMAGIVTAPLVAPVVGGLIETRFGWRSLFALLSMFGVLALCAITLLVPRDRRIGRPSGLCAALQDYQIVLGHRETLMAILTAACAFASLFAFLTGSSAVYMVHFGQSSAVYGVLFAMNGGAMLLANVLNANLVKRLQPSTLIALGAAIMGLAGTGLIVAVLFSQSLVLFVVLVATFFFGFGFVETNAAIIALAGFPERNGSVSALFGATQFGFGATASGMVVAFGNGSPLLVVSVMVLSTVSVGISTLLLLNVSKGVDHAPT